MVRSHNLGGRQEGEVFLLLFFKMVRLNGAKKLLNLVGFLRSMKYLKFSGPYPFVPRVLWFARDVYEASLCLVRRGAN